MSFFSGLLPKSECLKSTAATATRGVSFHADATARADRALQTILLDLKERPIEKITAKGNGIEIWGSEKREEG